VTAAEKELDAERSVWFSAHCIFEASVLDERKWAKSQTLDVDALLLDAEDSVVPANKLAAREQIVSHLRHNEDWLFLPRANHLSTQWGRDDVTAFAAAGARTIMYPKAESVADVEAVVDIIDRAGSGAGVLVAVESAAGVLAVETIAEHPRVVGLAVGAGDLHGELSVDLFDTDGSFSRLLENITMRVVVAARAHGLACVSTLYAQNIRDSDEASRRARDAASLGLTGLVAYYPPHVAPINQAFRPAPERVRDAEELVLLFDEARRAGEPAVRRADGSVVLIHDYLQAQQLLDRVKG
jgi:citrate lyase subunit beta / citryl-CoA lyase